MSDAHHAHGCPHAELAVGWVLHALEPAEESLVLAHLPDCDECTQAVAEAEIVSATLGASLPQVEPSPELERRILAETADKVAPVTPLRAEVRQEVRWWRTLPKVLAAAAALVLVAGSVALGVRVVQLEDQRAQAVAQYAAVSEAMKRVAEPGVVRVPMVSAEGRGVGMMLSGPGGVEFVATDLPRNDRSDEIYVLWGMRGGTPTALAGFDVAPDAPVAHPVPSTGGPGAFTGYAVSLERGRELPPTPTKVLASGQVES